MLDQEISIISRNIFGIGSHVSASTSQTHIQVRILIRRFLKLHKPLSTHETRSTILHNPAARRKVQSNDSQPSEKDICFLEY